MHEKLLTLVAQRVADGRVLRLIQAMLKAGSYGQGRLFPSERGTPQGGVVSPLLSNILLTPFGRETQRKGYQLTRYADDWVVTCRSAAEAQAAVDAALRTLKQLGLELHPQKTRIVHVQHGFEFLGYKIKRGKKLQLPESKVRSQARSGAQVSGWRRRANALASARRTNCTYSFPVCKLSPRLKHSGMQEKELTPPCEQTRTGGRAWPWAAVSSRHGASA